jgi:hypothetical protein
MSVCAHAGGQAGTTAGRFFLRGANMYGVQQFCEIKTTHLEITKKHETF